MGAEAIALAFPKLVERVVNHGNNGILSELAINCSIPALIAFKSVKVQSRLTYLISVGYLVCCEDW